MKRPGTHIATAVMAALIAAIAVAVCIRMYAHYPAGDELRYLYCFDNAQGRDYFAFATMRPVEDWGDIIHSMGFHYMGSTAAYSSTASRWPSHPWPDPNGSIR